MNFIQNKKQQLYSGEEFILRNNDCSIQTEKLSMPKACFANNWALTITPKILQLNAHLTREQVTLFLSL